MQKDGVPDTESNRQEYIEALIDTYVAQFLSPTDIDNYINLARKKENAQTLSMVANRDQATTEEIVKALREFCDIPKGEVYISREEAEGIRVALISRFISIIRMLTRLIFCWFLQEKRLLPGDLFREHRLKALLKDFGPNDPSFYRAILQNLFFATLNQPQQDDQGKPIREFRERMVSRYDPNRGITNLWRYKDDFRIPRPGRS